MNKQRERKLGKFDLFTRLSIVWRTLLINLKGFHTNLMENKKEAEMSVNRYNKASNVDAKKNDMNIVYYHRLVNGIYI